MPCLKQVEKLSNISATCFNRAVVDYFDHQTISSETVTDDLLSNMRNIFLGNVQAAVCESLLHNLNDGMKLHEIQKAIYIKLYKHRYLKTFNLQFKLPNNVGLFEGYIEGLNNLVVLNLTKVCTDEILEVVGKNCPLLEVIYIISKTESLSSKNDREINALKLKFFVSDNGLSFLHNCKCLKKIYMDKIIRSCCGGRKITHEGLRSLLYALPSIRYISYEDMGTVLEGWDDSSSLNLVHVHDNHVTPEHITLFNFICPSIQVLCLSIPTVVRDPNVPHSCLEKLINSDLSIKSLVLKSFPFDMSLQHYLKVKGECLTSLLLDHESSITTQSLVIVATYCKNLEHLFVKLLHSIHSDNETILAPGIKNSFSTLKTLKLFGIKWKPNIIFPLCIYNAKNLESLSLLNKYHEEDVHEAFELLSLKNPLLHLSKLSLFDGFILSEKGLVDFVLGCKVLKEITFKAESGYDKFFDQIIIDQNLDLTIRTESFANYGYCLCQNI